MITDFITVTFASTLLTGHRKSTHAVKKYTTIPKVIKPA